MSSSIETTHAPGPVGSYPHAKRVGQLLFLSGIGPRSPDDNSIPGNVAEQSGALLRYDIGLQTHQVMRNVEAVLKASGLGLSNLVDVTVYLTNMADDFKTYNAIWAQYFPIVSAAPCRTTLGISALPTPIAIELKCTAVYPEGSHAAAN